MDPNANLEEQERLTFAIRRCEDSDTTSHEHGTCDCQANGSRLAELVHALNTWLVNDGFFPDAWTRKRKLGERPDPKSSEVLVYVDKEHGNHLDVRVAGVNAYLSLNGTTIRLDLAHCLRLAGELVFHAEQQATP